MGTQASGAEPSAAQFAASLAATNDLSSRAHRTADYLCEVLRATAAVIYIADETAHQWVVTSFSGDAQVTTKRVPLDDGLLGIAASTGEVQVVTAPALTRESYSHLDVRRTVAGLAVLPIHHDEQVIGIAEVLTGEPAELIRNLPLAEQALKWAAPSFVAAQMFDSERNASLEAVSRLAQLYDLEKTFHSTLEMTELLPVVAAKAREVLPCEAINVWMVGGDDSIVLMSQDGDDPTQSVGSTSLGNESVAAAVADTGEALVVSSEDDERLASRNHDEAHVLCALAAPIISDNNLVGVIEAVNKHGGFDDHDVFVLGNICDTAAGALQNASRLQAERKAEILELLVAVSGQITSTLNLDKILNTVVNDTQALIPFERAAVALERKGQLKVQAVSGMTQILIGDAEVDNLHQMMSWAAMAGEEAHVVERDGVIDDPRDETRAKFEAYFAKSGMKAFYARPLTDDQGMLGVLAFESRDPDFLTEAHLEVIKVLAGQMTVAMRNAQLYKEVPFIGILEPVLEKRRKFRQMTARKRHLTTMAIVACAVILAIMPVPMRVDGGAKAQPLYSASLQPSFDSVVSRINVREGQRVQKGEVLAELDSTAEQAALASAEARQRTAVAAMNQALTANDSSRAGIQQGEAQYWVAEVNRERQRLELTKLRSPIDGIVTTPYAEYMMGRHLEAGTTLVEVVDTSEAVLDVALAEDDISMVRRGQGAVVKLDAFPARTLRGRVYTVSPRADGSTPPMFFARVAVPNQEGLIRAGMQGRSKVSVGWRPAGYVLFRTPAAWFWNKIWSWFGW
jgi:RND family efflux transporter MFP subunit